MSGKGERGPALRLLLLGVEGGGDQGLFHPLVTGDGHFHTQAGRYEDSEKTDVTLALGCGKRKEG